MCSIRGKFATILKSTSKCIFENLAFEEYIFRSHNVAKNGEVLLLWSNRPAVVIGRHQNPWLEVNLEFAKEYGIDVARRHSGGGTVYHDLGNLNISLLTTHAQHCRPKNLKFISEALNEKYNVCIIPNKRDDMELQPGDRKCSGTAARIAKGQAYHHLTLLIDADLRMLKMSLKSKLEGKIETNATRSVKAPAVGFLKQDDVLVNVQDSENEIINAYKSHFDHYKYEEVNPSLNDNPELLKIHQDLLNFKWIYGKSPKFVYTSESGHKYNVKDGIVNDSNGPDFKTGEQFPTLPSF